MIWLPIRSRRRVTSSLGVSGFLVGPEAPASMSIVTGPGPSPHIPTIEAAVAVAL